MDDLVQFLRERLDEADAVATAADGDEIEATPSLWGTKYLTLRGDHDDRHTTELPAHLADHVALHDPARVLAEVKAKRLRLDELAGALKAVHDSFDLAAVLLPLEALPYADHPDYRDEWRP